MSVHDIATQAAVNRTTFYAHFQDKYDFLEYWKTEKFKNFVNSRLPEDVSFNAEICEPLFKLSSIFCCRPDSTVHMVTSSLKPYSKCHS
ncbi:TetR family transcriptional regulator [Paenibacillus ferrarius]|uniref:TetR family transcriptional regulator n=1 Tax=Paenibacillus ferrarius TaxID=1469647 RepID=UPI003D26A3E8